MKTAIVGTAGRNKQIKMGLRTWQWMMNDAITRTQGDTHLVSGGAAWADHLAVWLYLKGYVGKLTLHLPAPFKGGMFVGPQHSSGGAANYYHRRFSQRVGHDTLADIEHAINMNGCDVTFEHERLGFTGMFNRNKKVAADADRLIAYTYGIGDEPDDGGTKNTWDQCKGIRTHVSLTRCIEDDF